MLLVDQTELFFGRRPADAQTVEPEPVESGIIGIEDDRANESSIDPGDASSYFIVF